MVDIADLRRKLNMTQEQFARELGVTVGTVNRWENGRFRPSPLADRAIKKLYAKLRRRQGTGADGQDGQDGQDEQDS